MTTYTVETAPTVQISSVRTPAWRWPADRVIPDVRDARITAWHQISTSVRLEKQDLSATWLGIGSSVVLSARAVGEILSELYTMIRPRPIAEFLMSNPATGTLLIEAYQQIQQHFGPSAVTIDVAVDPDGDDEPRLVVRVRTNLEPAQALGVLDQFDSDWWLDASLRGGDGICITLEYA